MIHLFNIRIHYNNDIYIYDMNKIHIYDMNIHIHYMNSIVTESPI